MENRHVPVPAPSRLPRLLGSRALALLSFLSLLLLACSPNARAQGGYPGGGGGYPGSYGGPVYTGGTVVTTSSSGYSNTTNYTSFSDGTYGGSYYASGSSDSHGANIISGTATCSGTITSTFTWNNGGNPNTMPPKCVILTEHCIANWNGEVSNGATVTGNCKNPLGGVAIPAVPGPGATWDWTRYTVINNPPATITVSCNPEADAKSAGSSTPGSSAIGSSGIRYSASVGPVGISLSGGIGPTTAKSLLIGQQLTATLYSPLTPTTWNWTASGGSPFKNWTASDANAVYTQLGPETGSSLVCYFAQPTAIGSFATVNCAVHIALPSASSPSGGLNVTATQTLTTVKPSSTLSIIIGNVDDLPSSINPAWVQLQRFPRNPPDEFASGFTFTGTITTPAAYVVSGNYGSWNWTQLITASRQEKNNGVYWQFAVSTTNPPTKINNHQVLDGSYPYSDFYPCDGNAYGNADSPAQGLDSSTAIREYDVSDSFQDFFMYQPPGAGSLPVPLKETDWYWTFQALKNASNSWSTSGNNAYWGFGSDFPAFPQWTFCATPNYLIYAP